MIVKAQSTKYPLTEFLAPVSKRYWKQNPTYPDATHVHLRVGPSQTVDLPKVLRAAGPWLERHGIEYSSLKSLKRSDTVEAGHIVVSIVEADS